MFSCKGLVVVSLFFSLKGESVIPDSPANKKSPHEMTHNGSRLCDVLAFLVM